MALLPPPDKAAAPADTPQNRARAAKAAAKEKGGGPFTALVLPQVPQDVAHASDLLTKAQAIIARELTRLDAKSFDKGLDPREVASVVTLIKAISGIVAEEKELAKTSALDKMSDAEVEELAQRAIDKRKPAPASTPAPDGYAAVLAELEEEEVPNE